MKWSYLRSTSKHFWMRIEVFTALSSTMATQKFEAKYNIILCGWSDWMDRMINGEDGASLHLQNPALISKKCFMYHLVTLWAKEWFKFKWLPWTLSQFVLKKKWANFLRTDKCEIFIVGQQQNRNSLCPHLDRFLLLRPVTSIIIKWTGFSYPGSCSWEQGCSPVQVSFS